MHLTKRLEDSSFFGRATKILVGLLLLATVGFAAYYYFDRYRGDSTPIADQQIGRLRQMIANDPSNPATRVALGNYYVNKGSYAEAVTQYGEALKLDDKNAGALAGMGLAFYRSGKPKEATAAFERIVELVKDNPPAQRTPAMAGVYYYLGQMYAGQGDLARAEATLSKALSINRGDADTIYQLAQVVAQQGRYEDAVTLYRAAIDYVPNFGEAYAGLAKAYTALGLANEAAYATAMADYSRGAYDAAIARLQPLVQARPDFAEAHFGLGAAYDKKSEREKAIAAYQEALKYRPEHEAARVSLARLGVKPPVRPAEVENK